MICDRTIEGEGVVGVIAWMGVRDVAIVRM
jgi:hypothetical protein